jgi:hypothetical protein
MAAVDMTDPDDTIVDAGYEKIPVTFSFNVGTMTKPDDVRHLHIHPNSALEFFGVDHHDVINPQDVSITTSANSGNFAVSLFHGVKTNAETGEVEPIYLKTIGTAGAISDSFKEGGEKAHQAHAFSFPGRVTTLNHKIMPSEGQTSEFEHDRLTKRLSSNWKMMTEANVNAEVEQTSLDGDKRYIVSAVDSNGTPSAIHKLLTSAKAGYMGGIFANDQRKAVGVDGQPGYELHPKELAHLHSTMTNILSTKTDFKHGFGVKIQRIGEPTITPNAKGVMTELEPLTGADKTFTVHLDFNRKPFHPETGFVQSAKPAITTQSHIDAYTGGGPTRSGVVGGTPVKIVRNLGFSDKIARDPNASGRINVEKVVPSLDVLAD